MSLVCGKGKIKIRFHFSFVDIVLPGLSSAWTRAEGNFLELRLTFFL